MVDVMEDIAVVEVPPGAANYRLREICGMFWLTLSRDESIYWFWVIILPSSLVISHMVNIE